MPETFHDIIVREQGFDNYREGAELLRAMGKEADSLDDALADNAKGLDVMSDEFKETASSLSSLAREQNEANLSLVKGAKEFKVFGVSINDITSKLGKYRAGLSQIPKIFGLGSRAAKLFFVALGPIGLALTAITALLTRTQGGIDFVSRVAAGAAAVFSSLTDALSSTGSAIVKLFKGDFRGAIDEFKGAANEIINIGADVAAAYDLEGQAQGLRDSQIALRREIALTRTEIKRLNLAAEDTTKSFAEREEAAARAGELERKNIERRLALENLNIDIIKQKQALGKNLTADDEELTAAIERRSSIEQESLELQTTLNNKLNTIRDQRRAAIRAEQQAQAEARAAALQAIKAEREELIRLRAEAIAFIADLKPLSNELSQTLNEQLKDAFEGIGANGRPIGETIGNFIKEGLQSSTDSGLAAIGERMIANLGKGITADTLETNIGDKLTDFLGSIPDALNSDQFAAFQTVFSSVTDAFVSDIDKQVAALDRVIEAQESKVNSLQDELDRELELQADGYANSADALQEQLITEETILAESNKRRIELEEQSRRAQVINDSISQASGLITAGANIFKAFSSIPFVGVPLAIAAIGLMVGSFAKLKIDALSATRLETGTDGNAVSDYFAPRGAKPNGKTDRYGGKGYRMVDGETGADMGIIFSGKESILDEGTSQAFAPYLESYKATGKLPSISVPDISGYAKSVNNPSYYVNISQGIDKSDLKEVMKEVLFDNLMQEKELIHDLNESALFIPDNQSGKIILKAGRSTRHIKIQG